MSTDNPDDGRLWVSTGHRQCYHTDRDCDRLKSDPQPRQEPDVGHLPLCEYCDGSVEPPGKSEDPCPFCGASVYHLADHLRHCDQKP